MTTETILFLLLERLKRQQSACPYCKCEYACEADCVLNGLWFDRDEPD